MSISPSSSLGNDSLHLQMERKCNLELRLFPAGIDADMQSSETSQSQSAESAESSQQLTIFYNGRICVCDVTEVQARTILCLASGETDESLAAWSTEPPRSSEESQPQALGLSMKRSLQRFLQKRKSRIMATSPYKQL